MTRFAKKYLLEKFHDDLHCPICAKLLHDPMLTKECLHRFCARCIQHEIALGLLNCPKCGRALPKKVPFKSDPNLASIIAKLVSQRKELVKKEIVEVVQQNGTNLEEYIKNEVDYMDSTNDNKERKSPTLEMQSNLSKEQYLCQQQQEQQRQQQEILLQDWGEKQRLNRDNCIPLVLWPDGSIFRNPDLPKYLRQPKYVYVPAETTVAHLAEYLLIRCEMEAKWNKRGQYNVELTHVEDERDEFTLLMREANQVDYLKFIDSNVSGDYTLMLKNNLEAPNIMLSVAHPFRAASPTLAITQLLLTSAATQQQQRGNNGSNTTISGSSRANNKHVVSNGSDQRNQHQLLQYQEQRNHKPSKVVYRFIKK